MVRIVRQVAAFCLLLSIAGTSLVQAQSAHGPACGGGAPISTSAMTTDHAHHSDGRVESPLIVDFQCDCGCLCSAMAGGASMGQASPSALCDSAWQTNEPPQRATTDATRAAHRLALLRPPNAA